MNYSHNKVTRKKKVENLEKHFKTKWQTNWLFENNYNLISSHGTQKH